MKFTHSSSRGCPWQPGFTLVEIIGVVALIAILAAILAPRVVGIIGRGKVNATAQAIASLKTATMDYIAQNSALPIRDGSAATNGAVANGRFDADLVAGGFLEKLFACGIGNQTFDNSPLPGRVHVRSQAASISKRAVKPTATTGGNSFDLDRDASIADFTTEHTVVAAVIPGAVLSEAIALNKEIDGVVNKGAKADTVGRCVYSDADPEKRVTIYVYIAHY
jgi:prepilin-type N-terminal cleavage/methylation domain-containing protein